MFSFLNLQLLSVPLCGCPLIYFTGVLPMDTRVVSSHLLLWLILCVNLGHKGQNMWLKIFLGVSAKVFLDQSHI